MKLPIRRDRRLLGPILISRTSIQDDDPLYRVGLAVERDERLAAEMAAWETATAGDGLADLPPFRSGT